MLRKFRWKWQLLKFYLTTSFLYMLVSHFSSFSLILKTGLSVVFYWILWLLFMLISLLYHLRSLCNWNILNGHIFVDSPSIRCRNSTWKLRGNYINFERESTSKLWHRFDVDISTWIRLSKSTKYRWVLHVDFSMSFRRQIDVTSVLAVSIF